MPKGGLCEPVSNHFSIQVWSQLWQRSHWGEQTGLILKLVSNRFKRSCVQKVIVCLSLSVMYHIRSLPLKWLSVGNNAMFLMLNQVLKAETSWQMCAIVSIIILIFHLILTNKYCERSCMCEIGPVVIRKIATWCSLHAFDSLVWNIKHNKIPPYMV